MVRIISRSASGRRVSFPASAGEQDRAGDRLFAVGVIGHHPTGHAKRLGRGAERQAVAQTLFQKCARVGPADRGQRLQPQRFGTEFGLVRPDHTMTLVDEACLGEHLQIAQRAKRT